jgi:DNA polymerase III subunit delta
MLYLLSGKEDFLRDEFLGQLKALMRRLPLGEHNIDELRPPSSVRDVIAACDQAPFLCEKRMVIAQGILGQSARGPGRRRARRSASDPSGGDAAELLGYVEHLPTSTHLVLVEDDPTLLQAFSVTDPGARKDFPRLRDGDVPNWITQRARKKGADISRAAAGELAQLVGSELRALDTEIDKLATYVAPGETIEVEPVHELVSAAGAGIFAFHDAIAERRPAAALAILHSMLTGGSDPTEIYAQVVALVRRLLVVKELTAERKPLARNAPAFGLTTSQYALDKLQRQVARIAISELERAYELLRDMDIAVKTGRIDAELALDLVVAEIVGLAATSEVGRSA